MALSTDEVFETIGSFGRYQLYVLILFNIIEWFWFGWPVLIMTFIAAEPPWRCVANATQCPLNGTMEPGHDNYTFRCHIPRHAWEFADDFTSVVTQFDLVCDKAIYGTVSSSLVFFGGIVSSLLAGSLGDKFGRKKVIYLFGFLVALFSVLSAFPNVYWLFAVFRFIVGFCLAGGSASVFVLITELVGVRHRSLMGTSLWYCWTLSLMALAGVAYLIRDWKMLCIVTGAPAIAIVFGWFCTPESLRWLLVKGKINKAKKLYRKIARVNGKELPEEGLEIDTGTDAQRLGDFRDLFKTRSLTKTTLISWFCWFVNALVYYGVFLSAPSIGGNMYLNFFLASVVELPAIPGGVWIYNRFGRKKGVIVPMLLAAVGAAVAVFLTADGESNKGILVGKIILSMIWAKFWIMISYDGVFIYSAELFPTVVRNVGISTSMACSKIGSFLSPYIVFLGRVHPLLPYGIMGILALIAGLLCLLLPETRFKPTLENIKHESHEGGTGTEEELNDDASIEINEERALLINA